MNPTFDLNAPIFQSALNEEPSLSLDFYSHGCILRKREGETISEYPVDPAPSSGRTSTNYCIASPSPHS